MLRLFSTINHFYAADRHVGGSLSFTFSSICGKLGLESAKELAMPHSIKDLDLSELSGAERILLAQELWDSARQEAETLPLTAEQHAEIQGRMAALDAGTMPTYPWEEVKQRLLSRK